MQMYNYCSTLSDSLPGCPFILLDFDLGSIEGEVLEKIKRRCMVCDLRETCKLGVERARVNFTLSGVGSLPNLTLRGDAAVLAEETAQVGY
jgi:hypothetical protein